MTVAATPRVEVAWPSAGSGSSEDAGASSASATFVP
jgi:hypothetical protein